MSPFCGGPDLKAQLMRKNGPEQKIVLSGGCFLGVQAVFQHIKGVTKAVSGYACGTAETAQYETVSSGTTGHAESVEVKGLRPRFLCRAGTFSASRRHSRSTRSIAVNPRARR